MAHSDLFEYGAERPPAADPDALLGDLNPPQREAVLCNDGPVLILAGAGSGKTRAITRKIAWLVAHGGYRPWEILAVTFTNKAAGEMRERCRHLLGAAAEDLWLGTFHRIGVRVLRRHGELIGVGRHFVIYDRDDMTAMVARCSKALGIDDKVFPPRAGVAFIDKAKQRCQGPDHPELPARTLPERTWVRLYAAYEEAMRAAGAVDFGDLIWLPLRLFREVPLVASEFRQRWRYVLVDEFQDTNTSQYELLKAVLNDGRRICVVGDDDQSIYRWRGADVGHILGFDQAFEDTAVIRLERNYRSSRNILEVAGALIAQNESRHAKTLWTERPAGDRVRLHGADTETGEAEYAVRRIRELESDYARGEMAIFYRTNAQSRSFEEALRRATIPHRVIGGVRFYDRAEVKDVMAYLRVVVNPADVVGLERIINTPPRGIGKTTVERIRQRAEADEVSFWKALRGLAQTGSKLQRKRLGAFIELIGGLRALAKSADAVDLVHAVIERTGLLDHLLAQDTAEAEARAENIRELVSAVGEFADDAEDPSLSAFLDQVALVSDLDQADPDQPHVALMTAHMAKGLEFDVVFVTGLEEGLMPHFNARDSQADVEEERRLVYVALTRARHVLHLSWAASRRRFGTVVLPDQSRFLDGLPETCLLREMPRRRRGAFATGYGQAGAPARSLGAAAGRPLAAPVEAPVDSPAGRSATGRGRWDEIAQEMPSYEDFSQLGDGLAPGREVFHATYGEGTVGSIDGQGPKAKVRVRFCDGVVRTIVARFLTLV